MKSFEHLNIWTFYQTHLQRHIEKEKLAQINVSFSQNNTILSNTCCLKDMFANSSHFKQIRCNPLKKRIKSQCKYMIYHIIDLFLCFGIVVWQQVKPGSPGSPACSHCRFTELPAKLPWQPCKCITIHWMRDCSGGVRPSVTERQPPYSAGPSLGVTFRYIYIYINNIISDLCILHRYGPLYPEGWVWDFIDVTVQGFGWKPCSWLGCC